MARIFGLSGRITGRKGDAVFSVRKGEQIVRQYNPMVLNPNTEAQTVQRAKMKLASQISSVFANVIAIPSNGAKTSRNIFTKTNFGLITRDEQAEGIKVSVDLQHIQLTKSGRAMTPFVAGIDKVNHVLNASLMRNAASLYDRVVYVVIGISANGQMNFRATKVATNATSNGTFPISFNTISGAFCIYAYGIKDLTSAAKSVFGNSQYQGGSGVASLISGRLVSMSDAQVTRTLGIMFSESDNVKSSDETPMSMYAICEDDNKAPYAFQFLKSGVMSSIYLDYEDGYESSYVDCYVNGEFSERISEEEPVSGTAEGNTSFVNIAHTYNAETHSYIYLQPGSFEDIDGLGIVPQGEEHTISVNVPDGKELIQFKVDDEVIEENPYTFTPEDTPIVVNAIVN